ncbi:M48 family metallopeptidase [Rhodoligotrophos appendicifer]
MGLKPATRGLLIDDLEVPVTFRRNARARRIVLRVSPDRTGIVLTLPPRTSERLALDFASKQRSWIMQRLSDGAGSVAFAPGSIIPLRGEEHTIVHSTTGRDVVRIEVEDGDHRLLVRGEPAHLPRRIGDWLKRQAKADIVSKSTHYAGRMGVTFKRITMRDQRSRWGSCSSDGNLSYSWRLILTPPFVLDYVAAHEVAHLLEMNHGDRFWSLVESHCPATPEARRWLKQHGPALHRYGP